ncbi:NAD(P)-dependent dehydrogenase (short-subunit alcohol dehydrogenase family) [Virgibacillus halotolerans]|uniref:glucose 1-dehydrogenase n=1 Tax=Virgibacillus halotolerans TaxID=1071053 RepID=UPI0019620BB3|nr:glucose 1-dehydrogenase [Virgibacillus halotolerans]MBM7599965.1 NAD(P)-dependent dehydrogenase (short-subunit alcohol dehydrogenase family) [Virgibacillus halotolerans]
MSELMQDKVGIITAGGSGIGRASAQAFAREGAKVIISDINDDMGQETVNMIKKAGGEASYIPCNVATEEDVVVLINKTVELYGRLDWAHNNAGIGVPSASITESDSSDWDRALQITATGMYYSIKHEIPAMLKSGGGAIVNTSSTAGLSGAENMAGYSASKWAVNGLTKSIALEYGKQGIRINSICPGMTLTPAVEKWSQEAPEQAEYIKSNIPLGRIGKPEDQANAAVWLCSDKAAYITGVNLPVDGGHTAK